MSIAASRLSELSSDPSLAPLARIQDLALCSLARDRGWREAAARLELSDRAAAVPLLDGTTIEVDPALARELMIDIARVAAAPGLDELDPLALIEASVTQHETQLQGLAADGGIEPSALMTCGQLLAWPLLLAIGERSRDRVRGRGWELGHCPVCAAWPLLAELRGIDRLRVLRCGRCAAEWATRHLLCPFCGNDDHRALGQVSAEGQRASRSAATCERCHSYIKSVATLRPLDAEDLAYTDLASVDLDLVALERGYGRPTQPAYALHVTLEGAT